MNSFISSALPDYYASQREVLATEPVVHAELSERGVVRIYAQYDGVGDSGQINEISYKDGADPAQSIEVDAQTRERVEALLYALLEVRHGGWENNDGAFGSFSWNLADGTLEHEHSQRFTDHETSVYEGFEIDDGEGS